MAMWRISETASICTSFRLSNTQAMPQFPRESSTGFSSLPAAVRWYSNPRFSGVRLRMAMPLSTSIFSREVSNDGDIFGRFLWNSVNLDAPRNISRMICRVHLSQSTCVAFEIGQASP